MKTLYFYIGEGAKCLEECEVCILCRPDDELLGETSLGRCVEIEVGDEIFNIVEFLNSVTYENEHVIDSICKLLTLMFQEGIKAARMEDGDKVVELKRRLQPTVDEIGRLSEESINTLNRVLALLRGDTTASGT